MSTIDQGKFASQRLTSEPLSHAANQPIQAVKKADLSIIIRKPRQCATNDGGIRNSSGVALLLNAISIHTFLHLVIMPAV